MNPITYLCFTLMSILIQFCLMDFTSEGIKNGKSALDINRTVKKGNPIDIIKRITQKPHALYYRTETLEAKKRNAFQSVFPNSTITESAFPTTGLVSTGIDLFYEDNNTMIDDAYTTETFFASTEIDNVTEITFLYKTSTVKPLKEKKNIIKQDKCPCDLLYQMCDINCCCDTDCTEKERLFFKGCEEGYGDSDKELRHMQTSECSNNAMENLFCIVKINLPDQRYIRYSEADATVINKVYKWHKTEKLESLSDMRKTIYSSGDPLLLLKNGTLHNVDLPMTTTNNYCKGKKPIRFLVNEAIKCNVKLKDLYAMQVLKITQDTNIVTYSNISNSTNLNCSTLLCANWSVLVCDEEECQSYNKELHDPLCSEAYCSNIAYKIEYMFYCNETGVITSTVKLYVEQVSTMLEFIQQYVHVTFYMTNNTYPGWPLSSMNRIITLSGNPGYIHGLPVIASNVESNQTHHFYNNTDEDYNYILFPYNKHGVCVLNRVMNNKIQFGHNKRMNCRLIMERTKFKNVSDACINIQERISNFLRLNEDIFISPFGKPVADVHWVLLKKLNNYNIYGEYHARDLKLLCYNIVTRFSLTIVYVDSGRDSKENKIISASIVGSPRNLTTYNEENYSFVISVDVNFIDASGAAMRVYAGAPLVSIHLPKNFFLPFY